MTNIVTDILRSWGIIGVAAYDAKLAVLSHFNVSYNLLTNSNYELVLSFRTMIIAFLRPPAPYNLVTRNVVCKLIIGKMKREQ